MPYDDSPFSTLFEYFLWASVGVALLVFGLMVFFLVRYRRRPETPEPEDAPRAGYFPRERDNKQLEIAWTVGPTLLVILLTAISLGPMEELWNTPEQATVIQVVGSQWVWAFTYPDNTTSFNELRVSRDTPVKLELTSTDVLHSFFISEFGIKEDAVPGVTTTIWFDPAEVGPGQYPIACAEYCGLDHSAMTATLIIVE